MSYNITDYQLPEEILQWAIEMGFNYVGIATWEMFFDWCEEVFGIYVEDNKTEDGLFDFRVFVNNSLIHCFTKNTKREGRVEACNTIIEYLDKQIPSQDIDEVTKL